MKKRERTKEVSTQVKNPDLVQRRRRQIVDASVRLFIQNGFHKTTTRQIASAAGFSIGSLYEYVASKDDVLYLVCDAIHEEVEQGVAAALSRNSSDIAALKEVIMEYIIVCDRMKDHLLLIYQETKSLPKKWRSNVLQNEVRITDIFVDVIARTIAAGEMPPMDDRSVELLAHNITVLGHMWTFRQWFLKRQYTLEEYISFQTEFILSAALEGDDS
ncbi:MAG: TetR/AcrR family transcriptional regulator [Proteobacteria bacterium]|nr:TetR/AcrR family transcriptional regulator [Pseudomonadota bacterium]